jgi:hypothetical protein
MKNFGIIIMLTAILAQVFCMDLSADSQNSKKEKATPYNYENTKVSFGKDLLSIEDRDTSFNLKIENRGLTILESLEGHTINFEKYSDNHERDQKHYESDHPHRARRFRGHWAGIEFGFNNYLTSENSIDMPADIDYMTLHSGKSKSFSINFTQLSLGLSRHIGFVTGLGINWNNYRFDGNNNIQKGADGIIEALYPDAKLEKSKLTTIYLNLPFILEMQIPVNHNHINLAGGAIGGLKLGSHTKMVFEDDRKTEKSYGDFSLNILRYGATARIGYENFHLFGTYYFTPLFRPGKTPAGYDLFPFELGVAFTFNN